MRRGRRGRRRRAGGPEEEEEGEGEGEDKEEKGGGSGGAAQQMRRAPHRLESYTHAHKHTRSFVSLFLQHKHTRTPNPSRLTGHGLPPHAAGVLLVRHTVGGVAAGAGV